MIRSLLVSFLMILVSTPASSGSRISASDYWPTDGWRTSLPEEQGVDSDLLAGMLEEIAAGDWHIRHVSMIRNRHLVLSTDIRPYDSGVKHVIHSCTKSILSALLGIAMEQGFVGGLADSVITYFPDTPIPNLGVAKKSLTLEHLLTMSSGLRTEDSYLHRWRGLRAMTGSSDWAGYVLGLPMIADPGTSFEYSNGVSHLLAAILQKNTGRTALDFAHEYLFSPLGITDVFWRENADGLNLGWSGIAMAPGDLAKIGLLYLNGGNWDRRQIVPAPWVTVSTSARITAGTMSDSYGYQWWVDDDGYFMMLGYGSQFAFVLPEQNMVVVFNCALTGSDFHIPVRLLDQYVIPAAGAGGGLPANPEAVARLQAAGRVLSSPEVMAPRSVPESVQACEGLPYHFDPNGMGLTQMTFDFSPDGDELELTLVVSGVSSKVKAGLDGLWRTTELPKGQLFAARGEWLEDGGLLIRDQIVGDTSTGETRIEFDDEVINCLVIKHFFGVHENLIGRLAADR